jgi:nitrate/TMAO reductase-like tetraheme cytochrome c subunit
MYDSRNIFSQLLRKPLYRAAFIFFSYFILIITCCSKKIVVVKGKVIDEKGLQIEGATVREKANNDCVISDPERGFKLENIELSGKLCITAWMEGYYIAGEKIGRNIDSVIIVLKPHQIEDNPYYTWLEPELSDRKKINNVLTSSGLFMANNKPFRYVFNGLNKTLSLGCIDCHGKNMYNEWVKSAHASGNKNDRFMSMYNGTDVHGNRSEMTRFQHSRDYGSYPLPRKENSLNYGPGYKLDYPNSAGNCASCHLPAAAVNNPYGTDPNNVTGINALGSHCDFCHKIDGVILNPVTNAPYDNRPGVISYSLKRPIDDEQIFFGPFDDVDEGVDVCLPKMKNSEYCAGCHDANFWDVPIYKSYSEWLNSPYREMGITCQSCHMKPDGVTVNFANKRGGVKRDPAMIATHKFEGAMDTSLLQNSLSLQTNLKIEYPALILKVIVINDKTGHHVPTDSPLRHVILHVKIMSENSNDLILKEGSMIPEWGGTGDLKDGNYAGKPGKIFAKVLEEKWTGISPSGSYWLPTRIVSDNRIAAFHSDTSIYVFHLEEGRKIHTDIQLIYRRAPKKLMLQKAWDTPDILMNRKQNTYTLNGPETISDIN